MEVPKTLNKHLIVLAITTLIIFGVTWRLLPHTPNFAPIGAIALVSGLALGWRGSLITMLGIMALSDLVLGSYSSMYWTWLAVGLIAGLGVGLRRMPTVWRLPLGTLGASSLFFLVSNFGTWASSGMYSMDLAGLMQCYMMALPFIRATLQSDILFSAFFLATYEVLLFAAARRAVAGQLVAAQRPLL